MTEKFAITLNKGKKKGAAIVLASALVLSLGTLTAFAASNLHSLQGTIDGNGDRYSTDGGQTWSNEAPEGATVSEGANGEYSVSIGTPSKDADENAAAFAEDGKNLYSTDGGKTWSENAPDDGSGIIIEAE